MSTPTVLPAAAMSRLAQVPGRVRPVPPRGATYLSLPALLLAGAAGAGVLPTGPALAAAILLLAARVAVPPIPVPRRRGAAYLAAGLGQLAVVGMLWRAGDAAAPSGLGPATLVPLLLAVPLVEVWVGGHRARLAGGLVRFDHREQYLRYLRRLSWTTLAALLPPLVAGAALAGTASRLPYGLSDHPGAPAMMLAMAGGVLLAGVVAVGWLLAARGRPGLSGAVSGGAALGAFALDASVPGLAAGSLSGWGQLLPALVVALAVAYLAGLVLAALVLLDHKSPPAVASPRPAALFRSYR